MTVTDMLTGAIAMASTVIALFFLRFWRSTRDRNSNSIKQNKDWSEIQ